jgi:fibronectin type 3 domain-containing protein
VNRRRTAVAALLSLAACTTSLDLDLARRIFRPARPPSVPELREAGADLPAPEGLRAQSGELRAVSLQWDPLLTPQVAGYAVERALAEQGPFARIGAVADHAETAFLDQGADGATRDDGSLVLGDGSTVFYRVRPFGPAGELGAQPSATVAATTAPPPAPPPGLRAWSHQPRAVPLAWEPSPDPTVGGYRVERSPTSRGPFQALAELGDRHVTVYVDRGLGDLRVFYYRVAARNRAGGVGAPSDPVRAVTKPEPLPPFGLRLAAQKLGANRIAWQPNVEGDITAYRFFRVKGRRRELLAELPASETEGWDPGVGADEAALYTVIALDRDGLDSSAAKPLAVTSVGYGLAATARRDGVSLTWNPRAEEGWQRSRVFRHAFMGTTELGVAEAGAWLDTDVKPGHRYRYSVVLERADGTQAPPASPVEIQVPESAKSPG